MTKNNKTKQKISQLAAVHTFNHSTQEAEAGDSL